MNKILIVVLVPLLDKEFNVFIPVNKKIGTIRNIIIDTISELSGGIFPTDNVNLYDQLTGNVLNNNEFIKNGDIQNGTKLILM